MPNTPPLKNSPRNNACRSWLFGQPCIYTLAPHLSPLHILTVHWNSSIFCPILCSHLPSFLPSLLKMRPAESLPNPSPTSISLSQYVLPISKNTSHPHYWQGWWHPSAPRRPLSTLSSFLLYLLSHLPSPLPRSGDTSFSLNATPWDNCQPALLQIPVSEPGSP